MTSGRRMSYRPEDDITPFDELATSDRWMLNRSLHAGDTLNPFSIINAKGQKLFSTQLDAKNPKLIHIFSGPVPDKSDPLMSVLPDAAKTSILSGGAVDDANREVLATINPKGSRTNLVITKASGENIMAIRQMPSGVYRFARDDAKVATEAAGMDTGTGELLDDVGQIGCEQVGKSTLCYDCDIYPDCDVRHRAYIFATVMHIDAQKPKQAT